MANSLSGQLSRKDIKNEKKRNGLKIIPFNDGNLKAASYDITPSIIAMSSALGMLETVYRDKNYPYGYFIYVKAKDTVLVVSNEYISVPNNIAGYVVSRVSKVSEGFGHVSTSIDPNWKGALLIGLSNPTNKPIKVYVGKNGKRNIKNSSLASITFHYLNEQCDDFNKVYEGMRMDLLEKICYLNRHGVKASLRKLIHIRRKKYTDFFLDYCNYNSIYSEREWKEFSKELQGTYGQCGKNEEKKHFSDFVIVERGIPVFIHWFEKHLSSFVFILKLIIAILIILGFLPEGVETIKGLF